MVHIVSARVELLCLHFFRTPGNVRTSFYGFHLFSHVFFTVFTCFCMVFDRFQIVKKRFRPISKYFKSVFDDFKMFWKVSRSLWIASLVISHLQKVSNIGFWCVFKASKTIQRHRHLANARCLPGVADQKLGSRMDAPIFVLERVLKFHFCGGHFIR